MSKKVIYICAVLMLQGIRKKPFESGEEVTPENFPAEHFDKLVKDGFIKEKPAEVVVEESADEKAKREADELAAAAEKEAADKAVADAAALEAAEGKGKPKK